MGVEVLWPVRIQNYFLKQWIHSSDLKVDWMRCHHLWHSWRWDGTFPPKRQETPIRLHGFTSQESRKFLSPFSYFINTLLQGLPQLRSLHSGPWNTRRPRLLPSSTSFTTNYFAFFLQCGIRVYLAVYPNRCFKSTTTGQLPLLKFNMNVMPLEATSNSYFFCFLRA